MALIPLNPPAAGVPERCPAADGPRILKLWHLASMDAPTVAVVWAYALAWAAHVRPAAGTVAALGLAVWAIYVVDRLLDAQTGLCRPEGHPLQQRHFFHWRHKRALGALAAIASSAAVWLVFPRLRVSALRPDGAVALATLMYFGGVHGRARSMRRLLGRAGAVVSRECVVGIIFTAGCILPALTTPQYAGALLLAPPACALAALAWLNVRAIGHWEGDSRANGIARSACALAASALTAAAALLQFAPRAAALMAMTAMSAALLLLLDRYRDRLEPVTLRAAADLVLLTPLLLLTGFLLQ